MISIVSLALTFFFQILWFNWFHRVWDERTKQKWEELMASQAVLFRKKALKLEGLLIKLGQFLSTRADLLPERFIKELEGLVDRVDPIPFEYSKKTLEEEWGTSLESYLDTLSNHPVASASIGEVYKGRLHSGETVAVKIQRYRVEEIFETDFRALKIVLWILQHFSKLGKKADLFALYKELVVTTHQELDFRQELDHGRYFKNRYENKTGIDVPTFYEDLSTQRVLVMEWIEGAKVTDAGFIKHHHIDREALAKRLFDLFIDQFLNEGYFQADPHQGNLLVKHDGTVIMIDFGMVGTVKKQDTKYIREIIKGFVLEDYDAIVEALKKMKFLLPKTDEQRVKQVLKDTAEVYLSNDINKFDAEVLNSVLTDLQEFVKEQPIQLPADYAFLGRAANIIIGVLTTVFPSIDLKEWGKPFVKEWLNGGKHASPLSFYTEVLRDSVKPLLSLPQSLLNKLNEGERERHFKERAFHQQSYYNFYMFYATLSFIMLLMGLCLTILAKVLSRGFMSEMGIPITVISFGLLILFFSKHLRRIKKGG